LNKNDNNCYTGSLQQFKQMLMQESMTNVQGTCQVYGTMFLSVCHTYNTTSSVQGYRAL